MSTSKSASMPNYDPGVSEGLQLASPYDPMIAEALQPAVQEPKYSTDNNWHEAPQVILREEPKYLTEDSSYTPASPLSPRTPRTPAPAYRPYPINRVSEDGICLTRAPTIDMSTIDLEKNKSKKNSGKKRICGCTRTVFWLSLALAFSIAIAASLAGGLIPINKDTSDQST
ncbi:hypothetical protein MPH_01013 [Macrophomina phaseolina MS6]|uniref:Uncharacterized protein n=1 Tax=Macrophomina phaseolina (strain MS6) TaxID=1126212 RepID=K2SYI2_MACPH|nr:hypothetical protein MPH_01013 [Macrophomina phaseolina MS6]